MKTIAAIALIFALAASNAAAAEVNETTAPSAISKVIVYSDRAIVERTMTLDLEPGEKRLVFDGLPENMEPNSLQARGSGKAILQDIVFRTTYFAAIPDDRIQALAAAKEEKDGRILQRTDKVKRANSEKGVLDKIIGKVTAQREGQDSELSPEKWGQLIKFYSERLTSLDEEIRVTEKEIRDLKLESDRIGQELGRLQAGRQKKKNQAIVVLRLPEHSKVALTLSYLVYGPSWQPIYDLRVNSETERLELSYNANVVQNTGEDWTNVSLSLSTARPEIGGTPSDLAPWYLAVLERKPAPRSAPSKSAAPAAAPPAKMYDEAAPESAARGSMKEAAISAESASVVAGAVAVMFDVSGNTTIASDNTSHRVSIFQNVFPAAFRYSTVPKLSVHAYLKAKVRNESDYPFLPGVAKVFLDGNFVANSALDLVAPGEEFWTFLGVDEGVKVEYKIVKIVRDELGFFEKKTRFTHQYEIKIINNKRTDAEIVVRDQLPISSDQRIVVKLIEPSYVQDTDTLKKDKQELLEWILRLGPHQSKTISLSFSVEFPSGLTVSGM